MLAEVTELCRNLCGAGVERVLVSFGWDSNLSTNEMWKDVEVSVAELPEYLAQAERAGTIEIGKADVFITADDLEFTLCHESDLHVAGSAPLVAETQRRWFNLGYEPYTIKQRV
jgi:hypothetical protein